MLKTTTNKERPKIMKNTVTFKNMAFLRGRLGSALAALLLLAGTVLSSLAGVLPPSSLPYGLSYQEWSAKWWQWSLEQSTNHLEYVGYPGVCEGPGSNVRFLAGVYIPGSGGISIETNHIVVSDQNPLFLSVLSVWVDNTGCPTFTTNSVDQLVAEAVGDWSFVTVTTCTIDGVAVPGLSNPTNSVYLVQASPFSYTTAERGNVLAAFDGDPCLGGGVTIYPAVAYGDYLMLSPLSPGKHTIHVVGVVGPESSPFVEDNITYDITVERGLGGFGF